MKKSSGGGEFKCSIIRYIVRTFVNATMYPHLAQQLIKKKRKKSDYCSS
jgi:hypothetical protein